MKISEIIVLFRTIVGVEYNSIILELGNRKLVAGQEDLILEIAAKMKHNDL